MREPSARRSKPFPKAVLFGLLAGLAALSGCGQGPLVVGAVYNLTGSQAELDVPSAEGARLAVDEANRSGGILGRRVELALEDGRTSPAVLAAKATVLLERHAASMPGMIGLSDTDMVLAAAPPVAASGRVFVTSGATSPRLPGRVPGGLFLACFGDNVQAAAAAEWAYRQRSLRRVAILYSTESSYTELLQGYFRTRFEELGGRVVSVTPYTFAGLGEDTIADVEEADFVYLAAQPEDGLRAVQLLRGAGVETPVLGGDGLDSEGLWEQHPELRDVFFTTHAWLGSDNDDPAVQAFLRAYAAAFPGGTADAFTALGYDAARLLLDAVRRAGSDDPAAVRTALAATKDFAGITGSISFPPGERIPSKSVTVLEIDGGERRFVADLVPERVPAP